MTLGSPWWLLGLVVWAGAAVYLMRGARERVGVPFLKFWRGEVVTRPVRPAWRMPPMAVVLGLLAGLTGIIGAAGPEMNRGGEGTEVVVIEDRGQTMSARGADGVTRGERLRREVMETLGRLKARVQEVVVPAGAPMATAVDTGAMMHTAVREALSSRERAVVVISDREVGDVPRGRCVQVMGPGYEDVGIDGLAVRATPWGQAMISVRNDSSATAAVLNVWGASWDGEERRVELPGRGEVGRYFFDVPAGVEWVGAAVRARGDALVVNDRAWAAREVGWPVVKVEVGDVAIRRVARVYAKDRVAGAGAKEVVIGTTAPAGEGVMVAEEGEHHMIGGDFVVSEHDVTAGVNWKWVASRRDLRLSSAGPPAGWTAVVSVGNRPFVAVAPGGRRAVWVGFKSDEFEGSPGFVVFWANLLTWVGGEERFGNGYVTGATLEMQRVEGDGDWLPGLYRDGDGRFHAVNAADVQARGGDADEWKARVAEVVRNAEGKWTLGPWVMVVAGGFFAAALFARRK